MESVLTQFAIDFDAWTETVVVDGTLTTREWVKGCDGIVASHSYGGWIVWHESKGVAVALAGGGHKQYNWKRVANDAKRRQLPAGVITMIEKIAAEDSEHEQ